MGLLELNKKSINPLGNMRSANVCTCSVCGSCATCFIFIFFLVGVLGPSLSSQLNNSTSN